MPACSCRANRSGYWPTIIGNLANLAKDEPVTTVTRRPQWIALKAGGANDLAPVATAGDERGVTLTVQASSTSFPTLGNLRNGALIEFPVPMSKVKFDLSAQTNFTGGSAQWIVFGQASFPATQSVVANASPLGALAPTAVVASLPSGFRNAVLLEMLMPFGSGVPPATNAWLLLNNLRALAPRGPSGLDTEPVYGHELVQDVVYQSLLAADYSQIDSDTSYQFLSADFSQPGQTLRAALDYITAFYSKYWAVWENKTISWKSTVLTTAPDWTVSANQGVKFTLEPSVAEAARSVRVSYRDVRGVSREITANDPRLDNVYAVARASKQAQINLPVVSNSSAAQQIANTYFPDHSYEVLRGKIIIPAQTLLTPRAGGSLPAYKIRAGQSIRILDAATPRDYFSTQYDRKTTLFIRTTDVDWEAQTITLEVDNTRDSISTLLARVALQTTSKFPGT